MRIARDREINLYVYLLQNVPVRARARGDQLFSRGMNFVNWRYGR